MKVSYDLRMRIQTRIRSFFGDIRYELTGERHPEFPKLSRIRRLSDGRIGGWVEGEHNLVQNSKAWIEANAIVCGKAVVTDCALVEGDAYIHGSARIYERAVVKDKARVGDNAHILGYSVVSGKSRVWSDGDICGSSEIIDSDIHTKGSVRNSKITDAFVRSNAWLNGCTVSERAEILDGDFTRCIIRGGLVVNTSGKLFDALITPETAASSKNAFKAAVLSNGRTATMFFSQHKNQWMVNGLIPGTDIRLDAMNIEESILRISGSCVEEYLDVLEMFSRHAARIDARQKAAESGADVKRLPSLEGISEVTS
jgi:hypothetical protein